MSDHGFNDQNMQFTSLCLSHQIFSLLLGVHFGCTSSLVSSSRAFASEAALESAFLDPMIGLWWSINQEAKADGYRTHIHS